ncbi:putative ribonuclease H-like domain-containing protein [Tanacetum coccineum]
MTVPSTAEEKICKKNDVKARSLLLMALPNEHQLTFDQYVDAQSMFAAIKARFGGNEATKKTQKALLKQYRLAILGVVTPPEDLNVKFLRSLPSEWDTHVVVWMNKPDFDYLQKRVCLDDLYNNFKIVEQKVKRSAGANNDDKNLAFLTTSGASSTKNINTVNPEVSTGTTKVNTASTEISTASFSDATVYAFLSTQPQGSQLVHEDLEQLHDDDLEEMDLKWNMALLSMRARKFYQRTGRKIIIDGSSTAGYDKSKVECFNCHKMGHFSRECRAPRSKDNKNWNQGSSSKASRIEDASDKRLYLRTELEKVKEEKGGFEFKIAKFEKSSKDLDQLLASQITDKSKKVRVEAPKKARENNDAPIIEDWVSDDKDDVEPIPKVEKKVVIPTATKKEFVKPEKPVRRSVSCPNVHKHMAPRAVLMKTGLKTVNTARPVNTVRSVNTGRPFSTASINKKSNSQLNDKGFVDSGCSRHMTGNIAHLSDFKDFDGGYVTFGGGAHGGKITGTGTIKLDETSEILKNFIKEVENLVDKKVKIIRSDNGTEFKNKVMDDFCREKGIKREYSVARTPQQNGVAERKNMTLIEAARTMLADSKLPTTFWAEVVSTACYVQNRVLIVKPHNKTPYELFRGFKPAIGFMKPFGCHVTILNTLVICGKFDEKSDEGVLILLFALFSTRTRLDCNAIWKDASPNNCDACSTRRIKDELHDEDDAIKESHDGSNLKENGTADPQVNTARPDINTGSREVSTALPEVNTATPCSIVLSKKGRLIRIFYMSFCLFPLQEDQKEFPALRDPAMGRAIAGGTSSIQIQKRLGFLLDLPKGHRAMGTNAFLYGQIEEEVYVCQPPGFEDPNHPNKVYKVQQKKKGIFISQDKYVHEILRKFNYSDVKSASTPTDLEKPLVQDGDADDVDEHLYRSMICLVVPYRSRQSYLCAVLHVQVLVASTDSEYAVRAYKGYESTTRGSVRFHQVIDFLNRSHICYALTKKPAISVSFIKQFWRSAEASTDDNGEVKIIATIDGHSLSITEGSLR